MKAQFNNKKTLLERPYRDKLCHTDGSLFQVPRRETPQRLQLYFTTSLPKSLGFLLQKTRKYVH